MKQTSKTASDFLVKLAEYKKLIDSDIEIYSKAVKRSTLQQYGSSARLEIDAFLDILGRGGKRIRGALTILGYEMSGGKNREMIIQAAKAVEMIHAYILIIDDIQDRSIMRRGDKTAHIKLAEYHSKNELAGSSEHFGMSIALDSSLAGMHAAQMILANLDVDDDLKLKVVSIINLTMTVTAHGQTNDIMNEVVADVSQEDLDRVLKWKTAHYTFLNPLHVGMVLAGADCHATDAITDYAINTGMSFQITDDMIGVFGSEAETGKSPMDDIKEGKRTVLAMYALNNSSSADKNFLIQMLGNENLTPAEFQRVKDIFVDTGALDYARKSANNYVTLALKSLEKEKDRWTDEGVNFLREMAEFMLKRTN
jgi:geranylgeranyl diphosphate synthase type I